VTPSETITRMLEADASGSLDELLASPDIQVSEEVWRTLVGLATDNLKAGRSHAAVRLCDLALTLARRLDIPVLQFPVYFLSCLCHQAQGDTAAALDSCEKALSSVSTETDVKQVRLATETKITLLANSAQPQNAASLFEASEALFTASDDTPARIRMAGLIALSYRQAGNVEQASRWYSRAEDIAAHHALTDAVLGLARDHSHCLLDAGRLEPARRRLERALELARQTHSVHEEALVRLDVGVIAMLLGDFEAAEDHLRQAKALFVQQGAHVDAARADIDLANIFINTERAPEGLALAAEVAASEAASGHSDIRTKANLVRCAAAAHLGKWDDVKTHLPSSVEALEREDTDPRDKAQARLLEGQLAAKSGMPTEAVARLRDASRQFQALGLDGHAAAAEVSCVELELASGNHAAAVASCDNAAALFAKSGNTQAEPRMRQLREGIQAHWVASLLDGLMEERQTANTLASTLRTQGGAFMAAFFETSHAKVMAMVSDQEIERACVLGNAVYDLALDLGDKRQAARAVHGLGVALKNAGQGRHAIDFEERALLLYEELGDSEECAGAEMDLALSHKGGGELQRARDLCCRALRRFEDTGDSDALLKGYTNLGNILKDMGEAEEAIPHLKRALQLADEAHDLRVLAIAWANLGAGYYLTHDMQAYVDAYNHALSAATASGDEQLTKRLEAVTGNIQEAVRASSREAELDLAALAAAKTAEDVRSILGSADTPPMHALLGTLLQKGIARIGEGSMPDGTMYLDAAERLCLCPSSPEDSGEMFQAVGTFCAEHDLSDRASRALKQAVDIFDAMDLQSKKGDALTNLARLALNQGRYSEAAHLVQLAREAHSRQHASPTLPFDFVIEAEIAARAGNLDGAMRLFRDAADLQVAQESFQGLLGVVAMPALSVLEEMGTPRHVADFNEYVSLAGFRLIVNKWPELKDSDERTAFLRDNAMPLLQEGFLHMFVCHLAPQAAADGRISDAQTLVDLGYEACALIGAHRLHIRILLADAEIATASGDEKRVLSLLRQMRSLLEKEDDREFQCQVLAEAAGILLRAGNIRMCTEFFVAAEEVAQENGDRATESELLMGHGLALKNCGRSREAIEHYRRALALLSDQKSVSATRIRLNLANALEIIGDRTEAIKEYEQVVNLAEHHGEHDLVASAYDGLGIAAKNLGDYEEAKRRYDQALALCDQHGLDDTRKNVTENKRILESLRGVVEPERPSAPNTRLPKHGEAARLNELAATEIRCGQPEAAIRHQMEALRLWRQLHHRQGIATAAVNLATCYAQTQNRRAALKWARRALPFADRCGVRDLAIQARIQLARQLMHVGSDTQQHAAQALPRDNDTPSYQLGSTDASSPAKLSPQQAEAMAVARRPYFLEAAKHLDRAIDLLREARRELVNEGARITLQEKHGDLFDAALQAAIGLADDDRILRYAEQARSSAFLDLLASAGERRLLAKLTPSSQEASSIVQHGKDGHLAEAQITGWGDLSHVWRSYVSTCGTSGEDSTLILLYYFVNAYMFYIYAIDPLYPEKMEYRCVACDPSACGGPDGAPLTAAVAEMRASLDASIEEIAALDAVESELAQVMATREGHRRTRQVRDNLRKRRSDLPGFLSSAETRITKAMHSLWGMLLAPMWSKIGDYRRVLVVPHRKLHHVPFHALPDVTGTTLTDMGIDVHYMPSLSAVKYTYQTRATAGTRSALCIGDPTGDLPSARRECQRVAERYEELTGGEILVGEKATRDAFTRLSGTASIIHLAMHGVFDDGNPMRSGLLFADGRLSARDMYNLDLTRTDTAVLSACLSGMSQVTDSDELLGLVRGFFHAGCTSVIASLWPVHSDATARLMSAFHTEITRGSRENKAAALRKAMLNVKRDFPFTVFWAPFCLYGRHE
jgi:CHAT domain-containing protein/tetratricopeptide (TPR) repeat protein